MFILTKTFRFEASHQLPKHSRKCARLHGHSWVLRVEVQGERLQEEGSSTGMLMDYGDISKVVQPLVEEHLDHWHLNESTGLENPTSEEVARWVFRRLAKVLPRLSAVIVEETCTSSCEYRPLR